MKETGIANDAANWESAVSAGTRAFMLLPASIREEIGRRAAEVAELKRTMHDAAAAVVATECRACEGACCRSGKYHFTLTDLLIHLALDAALPVPAFGGRMCPYLSSDGCMIAPLLRPYNCITFNCELIEKGLPGERLLLLREADGRLRNLCESLQFLAGYQNSSLLHRVEADGAAGISFRRK